MDIEFYAIMYQVLGTSASCVQKDKNEVFKMDKVKYIPVEALKQELAGCQFAVQCDMGSHYDYERIRAIKNILDWINSPSYFERLAHCGFEVPKTNDVSFDDDYLKDLLY